MELHFDGNAAFTAALAIAAGTGAQALGHHLRLPGIVILLFLGVLLGPDVANVVQPESLGTALPAIVGFAVAIILFEGGMSLNLKKVRRQGRAIQQLITVGALFSLALGAGLAMLVLGWRWQLGLLFGTLVIVTGPTVVTPLLRRLSVRKSVATVLEAEGVLIDAVGAITAAVALELVIAPTNTGIALAVPAIAGRLLFGIAIGAVMGAILGGMLRVRGLIPEGLENVIALGFAVLTFETADAVVHESGIAAVTIAGMVVGNLRTHSTHKIAEFQEQLTIMVIGMLFVLLVADVRIADIVQLGWPGLVVAAGCIVIVRPVSVFFGTLGSTLTRKEKAFVGWIGPRGIVAAAVASLFGYQLAEVGIEGGTALRALVFLVIAVTVLWSALTGGMAARALGLRRKSSDGWLVVGANPLGILMAKLLQDDGITTVIMDEDPVSITDAEHQGVRAIHSNALSDAGHMKAALDTRIGAIALTTNEEVNYVFGEKARLKHQSLRFAVSLTDMSAGVTAEMVDDFGGDLLFGGGVDLRRWNDRIRSGQTEVVWWTYAHPHKKSVLIDPPRKNRPHIPLVAQRRKHALEPVTEKSVLRKKLRVAFLFDRERAEESRMELLKAGWIEVESPTRTIG